MTFICKHCKHKLPISYRHEESPEHCFLCYVSEADKALIGIDPFEEFGVWMREHGYADVADCKPEEVDLDRLDEAVDIYSNAPSLP